MRENIQQRALAGIEPTSLHGVVICPYCWTVSVFKWGHDFRVHLEKVFTTLSVEMFNKVQVHKF